MASQGSSISPTLMDDYDMLLAVVAWSAADGRGAGAKVTAAGPHAVALRMAFGTQTVGFLKPAIFALSAIEYLPYMLNRCPTAVP